MTTEPTTPEITRIERRERHAAVEHECELCFEPIKPRQRYVRLVSVIDGVFSVRKYHLAEPGQDWCRDCKADKRTRAKGATPKTLADDPGEE